MEEENGHNFISCVKWVKRGVAKAIPDKVQLTEDELAEIIESKKLKIEEEPKEELVKKKKRKDHDDKYYFEQYDQEKVEADAFLNISNLAMYGNKNEQGGSTASKKVKDSGILEYESDDEKDDDLIKPNDNLILVGHVEKDASILEIYVHNEEEGSLYVHHDILLPSVPLCVEWLNLDPTDSKPGNLCAVGTMSPIIEVWDLDIVDVLESAFRLGRSVNKLKKNKRQFNNYTDGHTDAVLCLGWNQYYDHILASGSVDKTVLLWDLHVGKPSKRLTSFLKKVQTIKWHPNDNSILLVGSSDKKSRLFDCRDEDNSFKNWCHNGEVEVCEWMNDSNYYLVGTSTGVLSCVDRRQKGHVWSVEEAHQKEITGLNTNNQFANLILTSSADEHLTVWKVEDNNSNATSVMSKQMNLGQLLCADCCPDNPFLLALGGDKKSKNFKMYNLLNNDLVKETFKVCGSKTSKNKKTNDMLEDFNVVEFEPVEQSSTKIKKKKKKQK